MWANYPDLLAHPVPRYTSYPTALEFREDVGADAMLRAIASVEAGDDISLYVHIPYCQQICWYCGCNTGAANKAQRLSSYLEALEAEISMVGKLLGGRGRLRRLSFGGGSPNAIPPIAFVRLVDRILTMVQGPQPEISIEVDPRALTPEWALTLAAAQVTRVSFGVQSFAPDVQAAIGRIQPFEMIESCMASLRMRGVTKINFDLMYGLPGQSMDDLDQTIDQVITLKPSRIALFGYAHLPSQFPRQKRIDSATLPDADMRFRQSEHGYRRLVDAGYRAIGFDHFALPDDGLAIAAEDGRVHRNFQGFTDDPSKTVIGLGASAISIFPGLLAQNEKNPGRYRMLLSDNRLPVARGVQRDFDDRRRNDIIEGLLCRGMARIECDMLRRTVRDRLYGFEQRGLVRWCGEDLTIPETALPYARLVAAAFDTRFRWTETLAMGHCGPDRIAIAV